MSLWPRLAPKGCCHVTGNDAMRNDSPEGAGWRRDSEERSGSKETDSNHKTGGSRDGGGLPSRSQLLPGDRGPCKGVKLYWVLITLTWLEWPEVPSCLASPGACWSSGLVFSPWTTLWGDLKTAIPLASFSVPFSLFFSFCFVSSFLQFIVLSSLSLSLPSLPFFLLLSNLRLYSLSSL